MMLICLIFVISIAFCAQTPNLFSEEFIQIVNEKQDLWTAGMNFPKTINARHVSHLVGTLSGVESEDLKVIVYTNKTEMPQNFDARKKWPFCPTLSKIWNQGNCGSCWAIVTAEIISDRICIQSNGTKNFQASVQDLLSCCVECRKNCTAGNPIMALEYWKTTGIVSGGEYNSNIGCMPYKIQPCPYSVLGEELCPGISEIPSCNKTCAKGSCEIYEGNKSFGKDYRSPEHEDDIKFELFSNGPVMAIMMVFEDFVLYKNGIYKHVFGKEMGLHAVKIIGYGVENDTKYWTVVNSWSANWGDNGYFKIIRGKNESGIEEMVIAGYPLFN